MSAVRNKPSHILYFILHVSITFPSAAVCTTNYIEFTFILLTEVVYVYLSFA